MYTGSGGRDLSGNKRTNKEQSFDQKFESMNAALKLSCLRGLPVRVVRSFKEKRRCVCGCVCVREGRRAAAGGSMMMMMMMVRRRPTPDNLLARASATPSLDAQKKPNRTRTHPPHTTTTARTRRRPRTRCATTACTASSAAGACAARRASSCAGESAVSAAREGSGARLLVSRFVVLLLFSNVAFGLVC